MKKTYLKLSLLAVLVAGATMIISCEKESNENTMLPSSYTKSMDIPIPNYSTYEEVNEIINKVSTFDTLKELLDYEEAQGRKSIGAISDKLCEETDWEQFSSKEDIIEFYSENSNLLDTIVDKDEISILPKFDNTRMRYVANENGLFTIGNNAYKLFKDCVISTHKNNLNKLIYLDESNLNNLDTTIFSYAEKVLNIQVNHGSCAYGWKYENYTTSNGIRFRLCLRNIYISYAYIGTGVETQVYARSQKRTLGIWLPSKRTMSIIGDVSIHKKNGNIWENDTYSFNIEKRTTTILYPLHFEPVLNQVYTPATYHFSSFYIKGRNLNVPYVILSHN